MSIQDQIRALETLASIDAELKKVVEDLSLERAGLTNLKDSVAKLAEQLEARRSALTVSEKARNEQVGEVRNMTGQIEHSRDKLNRSRTERETNAATREIEELRKLVRDREEEIGKHVADIDATRQDLEAIEAEHTKLRAELDGKESDVNARLASAEATRAEMQAVRDAAAKKLPIPLYRKYDAIRLKKGFGVAQTTDGTCKACHMALPPQLFHSLRREPRLDQCPSCFRIIYFAPKAVESPE